MTSFLKLWENMNNDEDVSENDKSLEAIRMGINIRDDFWEDFLKLVNNAEALSDLLDIPATKIYKWRQLIKQAKEQVSEMDSNTKAKKNLKLIKTGINTK
jgi:hypothetical protein